jgi:hypothetical protein
MPPHRSDQRNIDAEIFDGLMNSFPDQKCTELTKHLILGDGSTLKIFLSVWASKGEILYGDDRELLQWLLDRALETGEADVSWETLLEYLGSNPTASQKKAIFETALRIVVTGAALDHDGVFMAMNLVRSHCSGQPEITEAAAEDDFQQEIRFVFYIGFLELMRRAKDPKALSPLRLTEATKLRD